MLETSKSDYVLFEASGLIKDALIREWNDIPANDIQGMRSYLLQYVINNPASSSFVRERIVQENLVTNLIFEFGEIENPILSRNLVLLALLRFWVLNTHLSYNLVLVLFTIFLTFYPCAYCTVLYEH